MIRAIIFDCFGVLAEDGWTPLKRKYIGDDQAKSQEVADLGKQNEFGLISTRDHNQRVADIMGINVHTLRGALDKRVPNIELFEYIKKHLKPKYKIGFLTNANYDVLHDLFTREQAEIFDATAMSYELKMIKPDERMFKIIADKLGVSMNECLFVDDQERYCVEAERLGMATIYFRSYEQFLKELPTKL